MRDVAGFEGLYAVTSCGKVWSYRSKKFLKPAATHGGYLQVFLYADGKRHNCYVHRLVAEAYIPNPLGLPQINHLNEIKADNYVNNLEWVTSKENCNYGTRNERQSRAQSRPVYCVELDKVFYGVNAAARELGLQNACISRCCQGTQKTTGGYHFRYADKEAANETN